MTANALDTLPDLVSPVELAAALGCSVGTVKRWAKKGKLPSPRRLNYHTLVWPKDELVKVLGGKHDSA